MTTFSRTASAVFGALTLAVLATGTASAGALDDIKARGKLICGTQGASPRFSFENPLTRKLDGYEVALCGLLADYLKVPIEYKVVTSEARIPELMQGRVDLLAALISYSEQRAQQFDFSNAYFREGFRFLVRADANINDFAGLETQRIGNTKGSLLEPIVLQRFPKATMISYDDEGQTFLALQQNKVVAMAGRISNLRTAQLKGGEANFKFLPENLLVSAVGFAIRKDPEFKATLNKFLVEAEASGKGAEIYQKYIGDLGLPREFKLGDPIDK